MTRTVVEGCLSVDVRRWHRNGWLTRGQGFATVFRVDEQSGLRMDVAIASNLMRFDFVLANGGRLQDVRQYVRLCWTDCALGGRRPWFRCPVQCCGRRIAILYLAGGKFACRQCHGLAYLCQAETPRLRRIRRGRKIRMRLGAGFSYADPIPPKPKGMRWQTYWRLRAMVGGQ
jgi:hypothetical protein